MHNLMIKKHKEPSNSTYVSYYKLHYIGNLSTEIKQKITKHCKFYCKSTNIKIVSSPLKVGDLFSVKESVPKYLSCPSCNVSYIGKTTCHFFLQISAERRDAHQLGKIIIKQTCKAHKYFCLTLFHLFYYCYCYCNHVALIIFKITSLIC